MTNDHFLFPVSGLPFPFSHLRSPVSCLPLLFPSLPPSIKIFYRCSSLFYPANVIPVKANLFYLIGIALNRRRGRLNRSRFVILTNNGEPYCIQGVSPPVIRFAGAQHFTIAQHNISLWINNKFIRSPAQLLHRVINKGIAILQVVLIFRKISLLYNTLSSCHKLWNNKQ